MQVSLSWMTHEMEVTQNARDLHLHVRALSHRDPERLRLVIPSRFLVLRCYIDVKMHQCGGPIHHISYPT